MPSPVCPVCGNCEIVEGDKHLYSGREFTVHRCTGCDLIFTTPSPTDQELDAYYSAGVATAESGYSFEYLSGAHEGFLEKPPSYLRITRDWVLSVSQHLRQKGSFLEVGCNLGLLSELLIKSSAMTHFGIELNAPAVAFCNARGRFQVATTRFEQDPFPEQTFDCIGLFDVFEHLPRPDSFLEIARRRLKPGGLMLLAVPNTDTLDLRLLRRFKQLRNGDLFPTVVPLFHLYGYNRRNLRMLFERHGFSYVTSKTYRFEHYGPAAVARAPRLGFNLNRIIGRAISMLGHLTRDDKLLIAFRRD
jgi:SAM-dependent methyltransferase